MKNHHDTLDVADLGIASELTQGSGLIGAEPVGYKQNTGISDVD